ncbi:hypothetical protein ACFX13_008200 [Malus domestica]
MDPPPQKGGRSSGEDGDDRDRRKNRRSVGFLEHSDRQRQLLGGGIGNYGIVGTGTDGQDSLEDKEDRYYASCRGGGRCDSRRLDFDFKMSTEILGSESGDHFTAEDDDGLLPTRLISSSSSATSALKTTSGMLKTERSVTARDFPPNLAPIQFLSTLNRCGRPKFIVEKVSMSDGRLLIYMDKDRRPRAAPADNCRRSTDSNAAGGGVNNGATVSKKLVLSYNSDSDQEQEDDDQILVEEDDQEIRRI